MKIYFSIAKKCLSGLFCILIIGAGVSVFAQNTVERRTEIFDEVWNTINEKYYDANFNGADWKAVGEKYRARLKAVSDEKSFYQLLDQMVGELKDSHTRVYSPQQREQRAKNQKTSVGLTIKKIENQIVVFSVAPDSEAARIGIKAAMVVVSIGDQPVEKLVSETKKTVGVSSSERALEMRVFSKILSGEPNTKLKIELKNSGKKSSKFELTRQTVSSKPQFDARIVSSEIGYIKFTNFDEAIEPQIKDALNRFKSTRGLILDLRGNGGGDGETGLRVAGYFLDDKITIAKIKTRTGEPPLPEIPMTLEAGEKSSRIYEKPLVILTDEGTASTSELITNALQEQKRAVVFGTNSCGCVLAFLNYKKLKGDGDMTMSEFDFVTANEKRLEGKGITPDRIVSQTLKDIRTNRDAALEEAVKFLIPNGK